LKYFKPILANKHTRNRPTVITQTKDQILPLPFSFTFLRFFLPRDEASFGLSLKLIISQNDTGKSLSPSHHTTSQNNTGIRLCFELGTCPNLRVSQDR